MPWQLQPSKPSPALTSQPPRGQAGEVVTFRLPSRIHRELQELIELRRVPAYRTMSDFIREAIVRHLDEIYEAEDSGIDEDTKKDWMLLRIQNQAETAKVKDDDNQKFLDNLRNSLSHANNTGKKSSFALHARIGQAALMNATDPDFSNELRLMLENFGIISVNGPSENVIPINPIGGKNGD